MATRGASTGEQALVRRAGWLALAASVMTVGLIAYGAWVRASGSGLGCPDWPLCNGDVVPALKGAAAIEFGHRVYAGVTTLTVGAAGWFAYRGRRTDPLTAKLTGAALLAILAQAALGAATVLTELDGSVRLAHLITAMITLGLLTAGAMQGLGIAGSAEPGVRIASAVLAAVAVVVLVGGGIVGSGVSAGCPGLPLCDERSAASAAWLHGTHRTVAVLLLAALVGIGVRMRRRRGTAFAVGLNHAAAVLVVLQIGVGVTAVIQTLPAWLRVAHLGLATLVWWSAVAQWALALRARDR